MIRKVIATFVLLLALCGACEANTWYVSPAGSPVGNGTINNPWDLQTALNQPPSVQPGDLIYMLGGTYSTANYNGFQNNLKGSASAPIIVRNYPGERAQIDGLINAYALYDSGSYTWWWGIEFMSSNTFRITGQTYGWSAVGIYMTGSGNKYINCVVHDTQGGFYGYNASPNDEIYGNMIYYNGFAGSDRNHGHNIYLQNITGMKWVTDNIDFDAADEGMQIYGSGNADVIGFDVEGNAVFNNSSWPSATVSYPGTHYTYNMLIAGGAIRQDIVTENNYSFFPLAANTGQGIWLGQWTIGQDVLATGNVAAGGVTPFGMALQSGPVTFTGNTIVASPGALDSVNLDISGSYGQNLSAYTWNDNTYYDQSQYGFYFGTYTSDFISFSGVNLSWAGWQQQTTLDANSTYDATAPTGEWVYVRPNKYESKRANIIIYNWNNSPTVNVDVSSVLSVGDVYIVQNAQDFYGPSVLSGTYSGGTIAVPMTETAKSPLIGSIQWNSALSNASMPSTSTTDQDFQTPPTSLPTFGTFVLMVPGAPDNPLPGVPTAPTPTAALQISTTSLANAQVGVTYNQTVSASGGSGSSTWSATGLPTGLTLSGNALSGTPTASGTFSVVLTVNDGRTTVSATLALVVISTTTAPTPTPTGNAATFVKLDTTTQGNWQSAYGVDGYSLANANQGLPPYDPSFAVQGQQNWTWASNTTDPRALQLPGGSGALAATWYSPSSFSFDINITTGTHQVVLYAVDWDSQGRSETIQVLDATTNAVLNTQTISSFTNGVYLIWNVTGNVIIKISCNTGPNAVISGAFFGGAGSSSSPTTPPTTSSSNSAVFVNKDVSTEGNWQGVYGADGYNIEGMPVSLPSYAVLSVTSANAWTWTASTTDPRALETPGPPSGLRQAACWFNAQTFTFDLNLTDGNVHQISLYVVDWDSGSRVQSVQITDAVTGTVLNTQNLSSFKGGTWLVWNITGHVKITVTNAASPNAVISGIFFD